MTTITDAEAAFAQAYIDAVAKQFGEVSAAAAKYTRESKAKGKKRRERADKFGENTCYRNAK